MYKAYLFFFLIFLSAPLAADLDDYPPTFCQLAQTYHYTQYQALIDELTERGIRDRCDLIELDHEGFQKVFAAVEEEMKALISDPKKADEDEWKRAVEKLFKLIQEKAVHVKRGIATPCARDFVDFFKDSYLIDLILKVIMAELRAMKDGNYVLWRATSTSPDVAKQIPDDQKKNESFSHGLFSGLLYDLDCITGACTYTRVYTAFQNFLGAQRKSEGYKFKFYRELRTLLPEYFDLQPDLPERYKAGLDVWKVLDEATAFYAQKYKVSKAFIKAINASRNIDDIQLVLKVTRLGVKSKKTIVEYRTNACGTVWGKLKEVHMEANKCKGRVAELEGKKSYLYGIVVSSKELEEVHEASVIDSDKVVDFRIDERGDFLEAKFAAYGKGEKFHIKMQVKSDAQCIEIYNNAPPHIFENRLREFVDNIEKNDNYLILINSFKRRERFARRASKNSQNITEIVPADTYGVERDDEGAAIEVG